MSIYRNQKYGFEFELSEEWSPCTKALPLLPSLMFLFSNGWIPRADVEFTTGPNEYLNVTVERIEPELPPEFLESFFAQYAQQMGFSFCVFGKIIASKKEHVWVSYQMTDNVWSKKYMIILNGTGYAITASCAGKELFIRRESNWDQIAGSLQLIEPLKQDFNSPNRQ